MPRINAKRMKIEIKTFEELNPHELYEILRLRSEVFVVEQVCVYQDIDNKDFKALHILGYKNDKLVAYTRCFAPGIYFAEAAIGRVIVKEGERKFGYGHDIMKASVQAINDSYQTQTIKLSAQQYLIKFYNTHQFKEIGEGYMEDGIPHIAMIRE